MGWGDTLGVVSRREYCKRSSPFLAAARSGLSVTLIFCTAWIEPTLAMMRAGVVRRLSAVITPGMLSANTPASADWNRTGAWSISSPLKL